MHFLQCFHLFFVLPFFTFNAFVAGVKFYDVNAGVVNECACGQFRNLLFNAYDMIDSASGCLLFFFYATVIGTLHYALVDKPRVAKAVRLVMEKQKSWELALEKRALCRARAAAQETVMTMYVFVSVYAICVIVHACASREKTFQNDDSVIIRLDGMVISLFPHALIMPIYGFEAWRLIDDTHSLPCTFRRPKTKCQAAKGAGRTPFKGPIDGAEYDRLFRQFSTACATGKRVQMDNALGKIVIRDCLLARARQRDKIKAL